MANRRIRFDKNDCYYYYFLSGTLFRPYNNILTCNLKVVDASVFLGREDNYSIYNMLDKDISLLTFKALNNIAPNYLCSKIQMAKNCHSHNTRRAAKNHLQIPSSNTKFGMRTFAYRASKLWNDLPNELLDIKSLLKFKTSVKDFFN